MNTGYATLRADATIERRTIEIQNVLARLDAKIKYYHASNSGAAASWPAAGTLGHVLELLKQIDDEFLGEQEC